MIKMTECPPSHTPQGDKCKPYDPRLRNNSNTNANYKVTNRWFMLKLTLKDHFVKLIKIKHASNYAHIWT